MKCEVLIVGGGIAGLASAYALARAGVDTLLVEAASAFGTHSSAQNAAILRTLIGDPQLTAIGRNAGALLASPPPGFTPGPLIDPVGLLLTADRALAPDFAAWLEAAGPAPYAACEAHLVDAKEAARLAPHIHHPDRAAFAPGEAAAAWLPGEGHIDIAALVEGFARGAAHPGPDGRPARLLTAAPLPGLINGDSKITGARLVDGRRIETERVLFTGGAWANGLAHEAGSPLRFAARRRHLAVCVPEPPTAVDPRWPIVWNHATAPGRSFYARPEAPGLLLCACDETELAPSTGPHEGSCPRDASALEDVAHATGLFVPSFASAGVQSWWAGWRTFPTSSHVARGRFTIGPDPEVAGLFWAAGLGGHGMTSSFEVGRLAARALVESLGREPADPLAGPDYGGAFRPARQTASSETLA
jgi:glycine/D-amino acid oxidase-like deaminating enzyme